MDHGCVGNHARESLHVCGCVCMCLCVPVCACVWNNSEVSTSSGIFWACEEDFGCFPAEMGVLGRFGAEEGVLSGCVWGMSVGVKADGGRPVGADGHSPGEGRLDLGGGRRGVTLWRVFWPFLLPASALCSNAEVGKLSAKGQTVNNCRLFRPHSLCCSSALPLQQKRSYRQYINKWAWLCPNETLFRETGCGP